MGMIRFLKATFSAVAAVATLSATPAGWAPLGALLRNSDAVVAVTVTSVSGTGSSPLVAARVLRSIKGSLPVGADITISAHGPFASSPLPNLDGQTCIWFLGQNGSTWTALPAVTGNLPAETACIPVPPTAPTIPGMTATTPEDALAIELLGALGADRTADQAEEFLIIGMADVQSAQLAASLPALAASTQARTRRTALSLLLRASVPQIAPLLAATDFTEDSRSLLTRSLCQYRSTNADDLKALGRLAQPPSPDSVRTCATYSLRATHSEASLSTFANLLEDSNSDIRYDAVVGIASFALGMPITRASAPGLPTPKVGASESDLRNYPSREAFAQDEQVFIRYWKEWLVQR